MNKKWRYALIFMVVLWICIKLLKIYFHTTYTKEEIEGWFEPITSKYGIKIVYEIGDDFFSPLENPPVPAGPLRQSKVTPIRHRVLKKYPVLLQTAFEKYPIDVSKKYLKIIQFAGEIDTGFLKYSGAYDPFRKMIYLVDNGTKNDGSAIRTFHHEFSSLLLFRHPFSINQWTDHNPPNFQYFGKISDNWAEMEKKCEAETNYYEKGMVSNYGLTDFENDFNEYSAMILTFPKKFKEIMNQHPRVRGKFLVWLEFYQKIDPIFTEEYLLGNG